MKQKGVCRVSFRNLYEGEHEQIISPSTVVLGIGMALVVQQVCTLGNFYFQCALISSPSDIVVTISSKATFG